MSSPGLRTISPHLITAIKAKKSARCLDLTLIFKLILKNYESRINRTAVLQIECLTSNQNRSSRSYSNWATRGYANSRPGHLADWISRGLDNSRSRRCHQKNEN